VSSSCVVIRTNHGHKDLFAPFPFKMRDVGCWLHFKPAVIFLEPFSNVIGGVGLVQSIELAAKGRVDMGKSLLPGLLENDQLQPSLVQVQAIPNDFGLSLFGRFSLQVMVASCRFRFFL